MAIVRQMISLSPLNPKWLTSVLTPSRVNSGNHQWMRGSVASKPVLRRPLGKLSRGWVAVVIFLGAAAMPPAAYGQTAPPFEVVETSIAEVQDALATGRLSAVALVQTYLERIEAYDKNGPRLNAVITLNPEAMADAARLDAEYRRTGKLVGPLHGVPVLVKDQVDVAGLPTTLGSVLMKDYVPPRDAAVVAKLRSAGAIILAKTTLGELGAGDTYGMLFGVTRNPFDPLLTAGGSSGGSGAALSANLGLVAVGQEFYASIRRPAAWNGVVAMRPSPGLVSRTGAWDGAPSRVGQLGPMARTVTDLAKLLDAMVGEDPEDPSTADGRGHIPPTYTAFLNGQGLKNARIGVLRTPMGDDSDPDSDDFREVAGVFEAAIDEMRAAGATTIEVEIPGLGEALATRALDPAEDGAATYFARNPHSPFRTRADLTVQPDYAKVIGVRRAKFRPPSIPAPSRDGYQRYMTARERLAAAIAKVMADHRLDAIIHKTVEHTATPIRDGIQPPFVNQKGATQLNTFLIDASAISVPAGFTSRGGAVGVTFLGPQFSEGTLIRLAYGYESTNPHRVSPPLTPALPQRPK
jgi:Asp-tRNA(Asn)/Glu-tRNA(Gln) amidotransferase A subunit family amidase